MCVDLYLGGDLAEWVLDHVEPRSVSRVITESARIAENAQALGHTVSVGQPSTLDFPAAEIGFCVHYARVFSPAFLVRYRVMYNLHPGFLPWGRGYYPVFWALWEQTPAGATLHEISEGIDEGPIVAQKAVQYSVADTGWGLHQRVRDAERELFVEYWGRIVAGENLPSHAHFGGGTYHARMEFVDLQKRAPWQSMSSEDLVRLVRALTFHGYPGLEITLNGQTFALRLEALDGRSHKDRT